MLGTGSVRMWENWWVQKRTFPADAIRSKPAQKGKRTLGFKSATSPTKSPNDAGIVKCPLELSGAQGEGGEHGRFSLRLAEV